MRYRLATIACAALALALAACAARVPPTREAFASATPRIDACRDLYTQLDATVAHAAVGDAQSTRIDGFPYLRIERFLAADDVKPRVDSGDFQAWVERLRDLDLKARHYELDNLPADLAAGLGAGVETRLAACAAILIGADLNSESGRARLLETARVPDDYSVAKRVFGLYPFTSLAFNAGVDAYHEDTHTDFSVSLESLAVEGRLVRYRPPSGSARMSPESISRLVRGADHAPQGIADLSSEDRRRLFETFAPVYEIDVVSDDDRIGMPVWTGEEFPSVDVGRPVVFRRISYTRFEGQMLLQLVYSVWFPARPSQGDLDLLSGHLDGITFRVTLGRDGRPLVYDSMHNCGCFHMFVPTTLLEQRPPPDGHEEPALVPQRIEPGEGRAVLRIARRTHYLQRVYFDDAIASGEVYSMRDDDSLRSLPAVDGGRRSLFEPDGLVRGSERAERWFFWPMGISEPGAMRQWGRHATLFVGTRHFDDAHLIERYFLTAGGK
jgi:hypothetical protein